MSKNQKGKDGINLLEVKITNNLIRAWIKTTQLTPKLMINFSSSLQNMVRADGINSNQSWGRLQENIRKHQGTLQIFDSNHHLLQGPLREWFGDDFMIKKMIRWWSWAVFVSFITMGVERIWWIWWYKQEKWSVSFIYVRI